MSGIGQRLSPKTAPVGSRVLARWAPSMDFEEMTVIEWSAAKRLKIQARDGTKWCDIGCEPWLVETL